MKDLQEAAEAHRLRVQDSRIGTIGIEYDFKMGAKYQAEIDKEEIQELVSALEVAKEYIRVMNYDSEDHPTIRFIDSQITKYLKP